MNDIGTRMKRLTKRQLLASDEGWRRRGTGTAVETSLKGWKRKCPADRKKVILAPGESKVETWSRKA